MRLWSSKAFGTSSTATSSSSSGKPSAARRGDRANRRLKCSGAVLAGVWGERGAVGVLFSAFVYIYIYFFFGGGVQFFCLVHGQLSVWRRAENCTSIVGFQGKSQKAGG